MGITEITGDQVRDVDELRIGLLADRPTNPKAGWIYCATDFKKFFVCFVDGTWVHVNPINLTGAVDGDYFKFNGATGFLIPTAITALQYGLDDDKPVDPNVGDVYIAVDTEIVYYCFEDNIWSPTYLPRNKLYDFEHDSNDDIMPVTMEAIFELDGTNDLMPTTEGTVDNEFEVVGGEITPKV
jgi:hypothetical protein